MTGATLNVRLDDAQVRQAFRHLAAAGADLRPLMAGLGGALESSTRERFDSNVGPDGQSWYPSLRVQHGIGSHTTLAETGVHLRDTINWQLDGGDAVEVGSNFVGAAIHQFGGTIIGRNGPLAFQLAGGGFVVVDSVEIPARPYLGVSAEDRETIPRLALQYVDRTLYGGQA